VKSPAASSKISNSGKQQKVKSQFVGKKQQSTIEKYFNRKQMNPYFQNGIYNPE
jgi:hypothetical protein